MYSTNFVCVCVLLRLAYCDKICHAHLNYRPLPVAVRVSFWHGVCPNGNLAARRRESKNNFGPVANRPNTRASIMSEAKSLIDISSATVTYAPQYIRYLKSLYIGCPTEKVEVCKTNLSPWFRVDPP